MPCAAAPLPLTNGELQDIFKFYNRTYWDGRLPTVLVVWTGLENRYGETDMLPDGRYVIRLDATKNREGNVARTTILHEMCHVRTWGEDAQHGPRWRAELHRIMLEGAFDDIV